MASLTRDDVQHVAYLARLGLTAEGLARLEGQLNHILDQSDRGRPGGPRDQPVDPRDRVRHAGLGSSG
jgi:hypothetical protein